MKRFVAICFSIAVILTMAACSRKEQPVSFAESCWKHVEDCKTEVLEDGTVSVTLIAPDYTAIVMYLAEEGVTGDIAMDVLEEAVSANPDAIKMYSFVAESGEHQAVQEAFMEQIAYDLFALAMGDYMEVR